ncbi:MAG: hypothetical protein IT208_13420 [Chthonomonadales bacterium]|nr:hypothetical protein [Chthonomonadales bacterium]
MHSQAARAAVLGCALLMAAAPSVCADDAPLTLARVYKPGTTYRYRIDAAAIVMGSDVVVERTIKLTVKEMKPNGDAVLLHTDEGGKVNVGGQEQETGAGGPVTMIKDKLGRVVKLTHDASDLSFMPPEAEHLLAIASEWLPPSKAVRAGDAWRSEIDNPAVKGRKLVVKTTLVGAEKVQGADAYRIRQAVDADTDEQGGKMRSEFTMLVDPTTGAELAMEGKVKGLPTQYGPLDMSVKLRALKPDDKAPGPEATPPAS